MSAGQGQELIPGVAAHSRTAGVIFLAEAGWQAVRILRPAAGEAGVEPVPFLLAGERSGLVVRGRKAGMRLVGVVAQAELRDRGVVFLFLLSVQEQGVASEGGIL